jgi:DNA-binding NtrC family response regulator
MAMVKKDFTILVIDDEAQLRKSLTEQLQEEGYTVYAASDSNQALSFLNSTTILLIILDLKLPVGMSGHEILKYVKTFYPKVKVLVLTGYANLKEGRAAKQEGADEFLSKPYNVEDLLQMVEALMKR